MADSKIAALRAASSNAPAAPSGAQALSYPWMTSAGRELVMPVRPPPASPKARRPPDPSTTPAQGFIKSTPPPGERDGLPPGYRRGRDGNRETSGMPGFVDGVTLPDGYNPNFRFNPELFDALAPREGGQNLMYGGMVPENPSAAAAPAAPEPSAEPPLVDMNLGLLEYMRPNQRAELAPEPAAAPAPEGAPLPSMADFDFLNYIQPVPVPVQTETAAAVQPPPPPGALDVQLDPQLLQFLMMRDFGGMEAMQ